MKPKFLTLLLLASLSSFAQVNVKKGIIYEADKVIGKIEGKVGVFRSAKLDFLTMDGKSILTVKEEIFDQIKFPPFTDYRWYNITFSDSKKQLKIENVSRCYNEKCIIELLAKHNIAINGNLITDQDAVIAQFDYSPKIQADTAQAFTDYEKGLSAKLTLIQTKRSKSDAIQLIENGDMTKIMQGGVTIGWVEKKQEGVNTYMAMLYKFYKATPANERIYAAFFKISSTNVKNKGFTYQDLKYHGLQMVNDWGNAEQELTRFLINGGYL
jgi:hypothetical protein